jgi:hypothetical protein
MLEEYNFQTLSYGRRKLYFFYFLTAKLGTYRCLKISKKILPLIRESLELKIPAYDYKTLWGFKPVINMDNGDNALLDFETNS